VLTADDSSLILSIAVSIVSILLLVWLWLDRRNRETDLSKDDELHFSLQDTRRTVVAGIMFVLSAGLYAGARIDPRINGQPNLRFVQVWLGIAMLVVLLLVLALIDWLATQQYARRHRRAIVREGLEILRDELRLRMAARGNGSSLEFEDRSRGQ